MKITRLSELRQRMSPMGWAVLALVLVVASATAVVGVALFKATGHPQQFSTQ